MSLANYICTGVIWWTTTPKKKGKPPKKAKNRHEKYRNKSKNKMVCGTVQTLKICVFSLTCSYTYRVCVAAAATTTFSLCCCCCCSPHQNPPLLPPTCRRGERFCLLCLRAHVRPSSHEIRGSKYFRVFCSGKKK